MNSKIIALSKYRLEKAKEDLTASRINLENGLIKASIIDLIMQYFIA